MIRSWQSTNHAGRSCQELWEIEGNIFFSFLRHMPRVGGSEGEYLARYDANLPSCPNRILLPGTFGPIFLGVNKIK